jgi:hypothetical protein
MRAKKYTLLAVVALAFFIAGCSTPSPGQAPAGTSPSAAAWSASDPVLLVDLPRRPDADPNPCHVSPADAGDIVDAA